MTLYESIIADVAKAVKRHLNEYRTTYWNEETTEQWLKEHPEVKSESDLRKANPSAYKNALAGDYLHDLFTVVWTKAKIVRYLKLHPEIKSPNQLLKHKSKVYYAAYRMGIIDELFPEKRTLNGGRPKKGSDEDAYYRAMADIDAEVRSERQKIEAERKLKKQMDKDVNKMWWPSAEECNGNLDWLLSNLVFKYNNFSDIDDRIRYRLQHLVFEGSLDEFVEICANKDLFKKMYREFIRNNAPIDTKVWSLKQFLRIWFMKISGTLASEKDFDDSYRIDDLDNWLKDNPFYA